jgi:hypothetical protein
MQDIQLDINSQGTASIAGTPLMRTNGGGCDAGSTYSHTVRVSSGNSAMSPTSWSDVFCFLQMAQCHTPVQLSVSHERVSWRILCRTAGQIHLAVTIDVCATRATRQRCAAQRWCSVKLVFNQWCVQCTDGQTVVEFNCRVARAQAAHAQQNGVGRKRIDIRNN